MDSDLIAAKLETFYPSPPLQLDTNPLCSSIFLCTIPALIKPVMNILHEPTQAWFREDRERRLGMTLEQLEAKEIGPAFDEQLEKLQAFCTTHKADDGPFVTGSKPVYADLMLASLFEALERLNVELYQRVMRHEGAFKALHNACRPWTKKDD